MTTKLPESWKPLVRGADDPPGTVAPKSLVAKLAEVMAAVERIPKRGRNDFHKYDYATEADIVATVRQELAARQVMLIPAVEAVTRDPVGEKGSVLTTLVMSFTFLDGESSESITRPWLGCGSDKDDKGIYKAMTGGEKYFLLKTFLMPTGDDPEADDKPKGTVVTAPAPPAAVPVAAPATAPTHPPIPPGPVTITSVRGEPTKKAGVTRYTVTLSTGQSATTIKQQLAALAEQLCQDAVPVTWQVKSTQWGEDLVSLRRASKATDEPPPLTDDEIPF